MPDQPASTDVLVLTSSSTDSRVVADLLGAHEIPSRVCATIDELLRRIREGAGAVVLAEEALTPLALEGLVEELDAQPAWSQLPILVLAVSGHDAGPLAERLSSKGHGHVNVLERPVRSSSLLMTVRSSLDSRRRQYEISDELTRRVTAETALKQSAALLGSFVEHAPAAIALLDRSMRYLCVSRRWLKDYGLTRDIIGRSHEDVLRDVPPGWREVCARALAGESRSGEADAWRRPDGSTGYLRWEVRPWRIADGAIGGITIATTDVTEIVDAALRVRDSEERFRTLADNISQFAWMADATGWIFWYNRRWYEYTGTTFDEMEGWGWQKVHHPDHLARVTTKFRRAIEMGETWEDTFPLRGIDGAYRWFLSRAHPIRDGGGTIVRWFGTNTDVTEQRASIEALRESDRLKDEFLAMLGHELRNPLAPIRNAAHVLRVVGKEEKGIRVAAEIIERQTSHMSRLVDDLLDVSRITRGKIELKKERLRLGDVLADAIEATQPLLDAAEHTFAVASWPDVWIHGDRARLTQVFMNLLANAAKFTPRGGHISLRTVSEADRVVVLVHDTGIGIEEAARKRIFDLFQQEHVSLDRTEGGLGIGLTLVKRLVEMHGGTVTVDSAGTGKGSEFAVRLPVLDEERVQSAESSSETERKPEALRILIVEDNRDMAESFRMLLEMSGHSVHIARDGMEALRMFAEFSPDVAFVDLGLPRVDGFGVAERVRARMGNRPFLVAVSGYGRPEDKRRAHEAGFNTHMTKPIDYATVTAVLAELAAAKTSDPQLSRILH